MITPSFGITATERVLPKMALDFTTALLDPRVTFTRSGNTATVVNSSGFVAPINADLPRFDYDPTTLVCKGLLIEEARTNLFLYSAEFDNAYWPKTRSTITANATTSPDGTLTGDKLVESIDNSTHYIARIDTTTNTSANTWSIYAKASERPSINISVREGTTFLRSANATFNLSAGTVGAVAVAGGASGTATIQNAGNGWYRCSLTVTLGGADLNSQVLFLINNGSVSSYQGNGTSGIFIWGAQLEVGAFPTSYIPTVAATVTRNADVAKMTGTNFSDWYNASEGVFVADFNSVDVGAGRFPNVITASNGSFAERIFLALNAGARRAAVYSSSANQYEISGGPIGSTTANAFNRLAVAYKVNSFNSAALGSLSITDTSGVVPTVDRLNLGSSATSTSALNGNLIALRFYPQRLINAEVQAFSK